LKKVYIIAVVVAVHLLLFWLLVSVRVDDTKPRPPKYVYYDVKMPKPIVKAPEPTSIAQVTPLPQPSVQSLSPDSLLPEKMASPDTSK
jgi:hypothetical protein